MKFIFFVIDDKSNSATADEMATIDLFNEKLQSSGLWIYACGISSPSNALIFDYRWDSSQVEKTSLNNEENFYSGFWIIDVADEDQAKELAKEASHACNRRIEIRAEL